ncbi:hypothetical protein HD554DRAFT_2207192 [Boletus coccyginus]|nr:hypothetical protein HD554DRAFT_2207192 [Boletus coccyginus]
MQALNGEVGMSSFDEDPPHTAPSGFDTASESTTVDYYMQPFPTKYTVGTAHTTARTTFEHIHDEQLANGSEIWAPFANEEEWALAKWLIKNMGQNQAEEFLKLNIIQLDARPSFHNKSDLLNAIDKLSNGVGWQCKSITLTGDCIDDDRQVQVEEIELWFYNPVNCVHEIIRNSMFCDQMEYTPKRHYMNKAGMNRVVNETCTTDKVLKELLNIIDSMAAAWPVYLMIGNLAKDVCQQASMHGTILLKYLPIIQLEGFSEKMKSLIKYQLFYYCMTCMLTLLVTAGTKEVLMVCTNSSTCHVWPILAAYIVDYLEQCLVACCMENHCLLCKVAPSAHGDHMGAESWQASIKDVFKDLGLRAVYPLFWALLPHYDIFRAFTPNLLHQLHKGVFKDHLVKWYISIMGTNEVNTQFKWIGKEHKKMEKVFAGLITSRQDSQLISTVRSILDFIFYSSLQSHTSGMLTTLDSFYAHKEVFIELGGREASHFNISKIHIMEHYMNMIWQFGSADGFNTESPEQLHIDYAKDAYCATNKKDFIIQMTVWLRHQEAIDCCSLTRQAGVLSGK